MNPTVLQLIPYIIGEIRHEGGSVTKTKLLKLLYLFDIAFYRKQSQTFTGFRWVYLHFGPWTNEYDDLLNQLESEGVIGRTISNIKTYDVEFLSTKDNLPVSDEFLKGTAAFLALRGVLNRWGTLTLDPILDYVYFQTEPMVSGKRYSPLDFSTVSPEPPLQYKRSASNTPPKKLQELRTKAAAIFAEAKKSEQKRKYDPIEYGEVFFRGMESLDKLD